MSVSDNNGMEEALEVESQIAKGWKSGGKGGKERALHGMAHGKAHRHTARSTWGTAVRRFFSQTIARCRLSHHRRQASRRAPKLPGVKFEGVVPAAACIRATQLRSE